MTHSDFERNNQSMESVPSTTSCINNLRIRIDAEGSVGIKMEKAVHDSCPLDRDNANHHVESDAAEAIPSEEGHKKAEAKEDHPLHILEG